MCRSGKYTVHCLLTALDNTYSDNAPQFLETSWKNQVVHQ